MTWPWAFVVAVVAALTVLALLLPGTSFGDVVGFFVIAASFAFVAVMFRRFGD